MSDTVFSDTIENIESGMISQLDDDACLNCGAVLPAGCKGFFKASDGCQLDSAIVEAANIDHGGD